MTYDIKNIVSEMYKFNPVLSEQHYQQFKLWNYDTG